MELISKSVELNPNDANAYGFRGWLYLFRIRNYQSAIEDFTKAIQLDYNDAKSFYYRGFAEEILKQNSEAIKDYSATISKDEEYLDAYFRRGLVKSSLNDRRGAIEDYDFIINYKGSKKMELFDLATVYNNKAYCLVELGESEKALPFVNKALDLNDKPAYIWDTRGEIYYRIGEYEKCIKDMSKAIELDKESENSFYYRGIFLKVKLGKNFGKKHVPIYQKLDNLGKRKHTKQ